MTIIGKRFSDAGLRDIVLVSSMIAKGSLRGALDGKQYNKALRSNADSCIKRRRNVT